MRWLVLVIALAGCGRLRFDDLSGRDAGAGGDDDGGDANINAGANYAFVTSTATDLTMVQNVAGADAICNARAVAGGLPGTYVAWVSTSTISARDRLAGARGWRRPDGRPFADTVGDILSGTIYYPLRIDELKADRGLDSLHVLTATGGNGLLDSNGACGDLASTTGGVRMGDASGGTTVWTDNVTGTCNQAMSFYCFGIDNNVQVMAPPSSNAKRAFLSTPFNLGGGRAAADAVCAGDATANGLTGTFVATMATGTAYAVQRLVPQPYQRLDNVQLTVDFTTVLAPLTQRADRSYAPAGVWVGATNAGTIGSPGTTCSDWTDTSTALNAYIGNSALSNAAGFFDGIGQCNSNFSAYCFEQ